MVPVAERRSCGLARRWLLVGAAGTARAVQIFDSGNYTSAQWAGGGSCRVLYAPRGSGAHALSGAELEQFDLVFTDDSSKVPWLEASGRYYFLEDRAFPLREHGRHLAQMKEMLPIDVRRQGMSVLLPPSLQGDEMAGIVEDGSILMPGNMFVDDGSFESRQRAFHDFVFSALLSDTTGTPPQSLVDCIAHGVVPILVGKHQVFNYTHFLPYGVVKLAQFSIEFAINFMMNAPEDAFYVYMNSIKIVQEFFHMRYRAPFHLRLQRHAAAACHALAKPQPALAMLTIYSARKNFGRRMALRDTWLPLLAQAQPRVMYKFLLADTFLDVGSSVDQLLLHERDLFDDMVFLAGTTDEYPIGRKGLAALKWVAHHTNAQFWLKSDDDIYMRPHPVLERLGRMQRAEAYWGAFDYSGIVVRDVNDPHYTPRDVWTDDVFPAYARGAFLAMSMDLVRQIVAEEQRAELAKIVVEDVSYGFFLWQLVFMRNLTSVTLLDNDEQHFAMDPKCCTEQSHPNDCWLPLSGETWVVHHIKPQTVRCMFAADVAAGIYELAAPRPRSSDLDALLRRMLAHDPHVEGALHADRRAASRGTAPRAGGLPTLCGCVDTPPAHPGQPKPSEVLKEFSTGPRLH